MNNKNIKLKHLIIISAVILAIAVTLIGVYTLFHYDSDSQNFRKLEKICAEMTIEQKLRYIQDGEEVLEYLDSVINSDSINPEERFNARRSACTIERELDIVKKYLPEEMR